MQAIKIKLRAKELLVGVNSQAVLLLVIGLLLSAFLGILPAVTDILLGYDVINNQLMAVWSYMPAAVSLLLAVVFLTAALLLLSPFRIGKEAWFLGGAMGKKRKGRWIAFWFRPKRAFKAAGLCIVLRILKTGWQILFISPGAAILGGAVYMMLNGGIELNMFAVMAAGGALAALIGVVVSLVTVQRYFLAEYFLAKEPNLKIKEAVKGSIEHMERRCVKTALFKMSFIPWFLICLILLPVAFVWPYYKQSCAYWGLQLMNEIITPAPVMDTVSDETKAIDLEGILNNNTIPTD